MFDTIGFCLLICLRSIPYDELRSDQRTMDGLAARLESSLGRPGTGIN